MLAVLLVLSVAPVVAQTNQQPPAQQSTPGADTDPTEPVVFSLREEYYNPSGDLWTNVFILRKDKAVLRNKGSLSGKRGFLTRFDLPFVVSHAGGNTSGGLGDLYGQVLWVPHLTRKFGFAAGTGLVLPSATDRKLGAGKWQVVPTAAPIWFIQRRGFFLLRVQDFISFAGNKNRPDIHYTATVPTLLLRVGRKWWVSPDTEIRIDWKKGGSTGFKSGLQVGRMLNPRVGIWIKPEIPWGRYPRGGWVLKFAVLWVRP